MTTHTDKLVAECMQLADAYAVQSFRSSQMSAYRNQAVRTALEASIRALVPDGWVAVPRVPTREMIDAAGMTPGMKVIDSILGFDQARRGGYDAPELGTTPETSALAQAYRAMLAAAPSLPEADR
jgi:hypothetical protein